MALGVRGEGLDVGALSFVCWRLKFYSCDSAHVFLVGAFCGNVR